MGTHERSFAMAARSASEPPVRVLALEASKGTPPACGAVARRRACRYLAKRRLPKALWPIVVAMIFIAIIFDRRIEPALARAFNDNRRPRREARLADDGQDEEVYPLPSDTGAALNEGAAPRYRPSTDFRTRHAAQVIASLIRNRGQLDNGVLREKWKHLDRISMPLAVYLRDVDANDEWSALEQEIAVCSLPSKSATGPGAPSAVKHRKILELMPEWLRRGEGLLSSPDPHDPGPMETPEHRPDDGDTPPTVEAANSSGCHHYG